MIKREVVWLIVKLMGTYFIYLAFVSLFSLISSVAALNSLASQPASEKADTNSAITSVQPNFPSRTERKEEKPIADSASDRIKTEALKMLLWYVFLTGIYGAVGFYLIRDGRLLFAMLNREDKPVSDSKEINSLGIFDGEK